MCEKNIKVVNTQQVGTALLVEVQYCKNENNRRGKILLFKDSHKEEFLRRGEIFYDFSNHVLSPIAMFEISLTGISLAINSAKFIGLQDSVDNLGV